MSYFKTKMHPIRFPLRLCPRPCWGSLQGFPDPIAGGEEGRTGRKREGVGMGIVGEAGDEKRW